MRLRVREPPTLPFRWLETLWFQLTGTLCNIACRHCFIHCGPKADQIPMMSLDAVREGLEDGRSRGMKQVYFTGGEPFMHPQIQEACALALEQAPLTILTNGLLFDDATVAWVSELFARSRYSFDLRVSLDGMSSAQNDPVRGIGTFEQVTAAIQRLARAGLSPVVTVVEHDEDLAAAEVRTRFLAFLKGLGVRQPRVKFMPLLRIGREPRRTHGYEDPDILDGELLSPEVEGSLLCASGRCLTAHGAFPCPILVEQGSARMGASLAEAIRPLKLGFSACQTCVLDGLRCTT
jgi:MoaA/NifB/PqqE/SkfB family radical SAM enzyme